MTNLKPAILLGFYTLCLSGAAAAAPYPPAGSWRFAVMLDGKRIGEHDFAVVRQANEVVVDTEAHFKVKVGFIPVFEYDHKDHEVWRNDCLAQISSRTHDNGKTFTVQGVLRGDGFEVQGAHGAATLPGCVSTFAYWDQHFLTEQRLLNSQSGEYQPVTVTREGIENLKVGAQTIPAQRYSLQAPKLDIILWYSAAGDWVALESKLENGRTLRYEIQ
jgi:Family of unknown function (DUF6134)